MRVHRSGYRVYGFRFGIEGWVLGERVEGVGFGGLVFKAHTLLYHSTLGSRVIKKRRRWGSGGTETAQNTNSQSAYDTNPAAPAAFTCGHGNASGLGVALEGMSLMVNGRQGYLTQRKQRPPRTLQEDYAYVPMVVLRGGAVSYERGTPVRDGCPATPAAFTRGYTSGFRV